MQSRAKRSHGLCPLLHDRRTLTVLAEVSRECSRREINQSSFILRGELYVRGKDLLRTIQRATQHLVDIDAARSIYDVRRINANLILVKCDSQFQRLRITDKRKAFSSISSSGGAHIPATVQEVLHARLFVDDYCTKEQLQIRHSLWPKFRELKAALMGPYFKGEVLYYTPPGAKRAVRYTKEQPHTAHAEVQEQPQQQQQQQPQQPQQSQSQTQQPMAEHAMAVVEKAVEQPPHAAKPAYQPQPQAKSSAPAVGTSACTSARAPPPTPEEPPASLAEATAAPSTMASQPAPKETASQPDPQHKQTRQPAVNPGKQSTDRPPLRNTTNTTARPPSRSAEPTKRSAQPKPVWGAGNGAHKAHVGRKPHMLPSGQVVFW